ncbi:MAG TPA: hypothetical protein VIJ57_02070 [Hanamia sp.]
MENDEVKLSESESLLLIASMINKAKNRFSESGTLYLLWGWLILICCIVQFIGFYFFDTDAYYIWFSTWFLLIYQIFYLRKKIKTQKIKTYTEEINGFVWLVFFICMILVAFIGIQFKKYEIISPMILVLYGMPTFLSGIILKFKPLIIGGICCWIIASVSPFINIDYQLLLTSAAVISGWIIPGYLLKQKFKKAN